MAYASIQDPVQGYAASVDSLQRLRTSTCYPSVPNISGTLLAMGTATSIAIARPDRLNIDIRNNGPNLVYIRPGTGATAGDFPLGVGERYSLPIGVCFGGAFEAFDPVGGSTVSVIDYATS